MMEWTYFGISLPRRIWLAFFVCLLTGMAIDLTRFGIGLSIGADIVFLFLKLFLLLFAAHLLTYVRHSSRIRKISAKIEETYGKPLTKDEIAEMENDAKVQRVLHLGRLVNFLALHAATTIACLIAAKKLLAQ